MPWLRRLCRLLGLPAVLPEDRLRPDAGRRGNRMAGFVVVAVLMRPLGGWLSDRFGPVPVLAAATPSSPPARRSPRTPPLLSRRAPSRSCPWPPRSAVRSGATFALVAQVTDPAEGRRRDRPRRCRRRPRRLRPAADHGLRLRPHRVVRHRPDLLSRHRGPARCVLTLTIVRRPPDAARARAATTVTHCMSTGRPHDARHRPGRRAQRGPGPDPPLLHQGRGLRRPAHAAPDRRPRAPTTSTGTAGATTRWCAPRTA